MRLFRSEKTEDRYILREAMMIYDKHTKTNFSYAVGNFNSFEILLQQGGEFLWHDVASLQELGFSLQPSKGTIEPGQKHTINITWTPNREYKVRNKSFYHSCWCSCESSQGKVVCVCVCLCFSPLRWCRHVCQFHWRELRRPSTGSPWWLWSPPLQTDLCGTWTLACGTFIYASKDFYYLSVKLIFFRGITGCVKYC